VVLVLVLLHEGLFWCVDGGAGSVVVVPKAELVVQQATKVPGLMLTV